MSDKALPQPESLGAHGLAGQAPKLPFATRWAIRWDRARRWEFWPAWLFYAPIVGWILWLGFRSGSWTAFTAANPMMESSGAVGETKAPILAALAACEPDLVAEFRLLDQPALAQRLAAAESAVPLFGGYPVVLKPDIGQRGRGVAVIRDAHALERYLADAPGSVLIQRYIGGAEFGVFIYREPLDGRTRVYSVTRKCFPDLTGDGRTPLGQLILHDPRARLIAPLLWTRFASRLRSIPAAGERFPLVEIGAHCRGSMFLNAEELITPALTQVFDRVFAALPGYGFGRVDLRCESPQALAAGRGIRILEINGVTAEAAHIYHPGTPLIEGYRSMFHQWRVAFALGLQNQRAGAPVIPPWPLFLRFLEDLKRGDGWS